MLLGPGQKSSKLMMDLVSKFCNEEALLHETCALKLGTKKACLQLYEHHRLV